MEPEWSKQIESATICNYFYILAVAYAVLGGLGLLNFVFGASAKLPVSIKLFGLLFYAFFFMVILTFYFFMYILCDRALLAKKEGFFARA